MSRDPERSQLDFGSFLQSISGFLRDTLGAEKLIENEDYIPGSKRVDFYPGFQRSGVRVDFEGLQNETLGNEQYENALLSRIRDLHDFNLVILVGGLGAGKSTTVRHLTESLGSCPQGESCSCGRPSCPRRPLVVDCIQIGSNVKKKAAVRRVLRDIRFAIYARLIEEWIASSSLSPNLVREIDDQYMVLRRLLIANDLVNWQGPAHKNHVDLPTAYLPLEGNLLEMEPSYELIRGLVSQHKSSAQKLDSRIKEIADDSEESVDLMRLLLQFYVSRCAGDNPRNLLVVDNLDQLPTSRIEAVLDELLDIASDLVSLPILVPLRPSSVANRSYKRQLIFRYHYGPDNFEMVLHRIAKYVLSRSLNDLLGREKSALKSPWPPNHFPSEPEVRSFLIGAYIYSLILAAGRSPAIPPRQQLKEIIHPDHSFLLNLHLTSSALDDLADTLNALVGRCCRYALDQLQRFFQNLYTRPLLLMSALERLGRAKVDQLLPISYGNMVYTLIAENPKPIPIPRVSNLFLAARVSTHPHLPSLTKLRILSLLHGRPRHSVKEICTRLALYGIPKEATVASLNSLHNKFRLLVWFSKNTDLRHKKARDFRQDVVLSEHGHEYFTNVLGNFEYVWYCATELAEREVTAYSITFKTKLEEYRRLIDLLGDTEWKQICFHRCSENAIADFSAELNLNEMITLRVLYSTLATAVSSAEIALGLRKISSETKQKIETLVSSLSEKIRFWEERYRLCYGGTGYLVLYSSELKRVQSALVSLQASGHVNKAFEKLITDLVNEWTRNPEQSKPTPRVGSKPPKEDLVSLVSRCGRGIPGLDKLVKQLDRQELSRIYLGQFLRTREIFRSLLGERLPTYSEVFAYVNYLAMNADNFISSAKKHAAAGATTLAWFIEQEQELKEFARRLAENSFTLSGTCSEPEMSANKRKFNNVMSLLLELATEFGVVSVEHLSARWHS